MKSQQIHPRLRLFLRILLLTAAALLIAAGIQNGGYHDTWSKAIRICFECIGIG